MQIPKFATIDLGDVMKAIAVAALVAVSFVMPAHAQDLTICTAAGYSAACCKASYAKYGPFGSANGNQKKARRADLEHCKASGK
jgi:hypothetical protein